jgi:hypothetical protein
MKPNCLEANSAALAAASRIDHGSAEHAPAIVALTDIPITMFGH